MWKQEEKATHAAPKRSGAQADQKLGYQILPALLVEFPNSLSASQSLKRQIHSTSTIPTGGSDLQQPGGAGEGRESTADLEGASAELGGSGENEPRRK